MAAQLLPDAILTIGLDSRIVFANRTAEALFGYEPGGMVGLTLAETIIPPEMAAQHARGMAQYATSRAGPVLGKRIEVVARDRSGRRFPIELAIYPDSSQEGRIIHAQIRDVSERVARDAEARAERDRFALFLDATTDGWWDCDVAGATRYSERLLKLQAGAGRTAATVAPSELAWIDPDDAVRVREAWRAHLDGSAGRYECTYRSTRDVPRASSEQPPMSPSSRLRSWHSRTRSGSSCSGFSPVGSRTTSTTS
jgi:PAS domain S-box-containing protein